MDAWVRCSVSLSVKNKNKNKNTDRVPLTLSELSLPTVVLVMKKEVEDLLSEQILFPTQITRD